jgi:hypothetical protein
MTHKIQMQLEACTWSSCSYKQWQMEHLAADGKICNDCLMTMDEIVCVFGYPSTEEVNIILLTVEFFVIEISRCNAIIGLKVTQVITISIFLTASV